MAIRFENSMWKVEKILDFRDFPPAHMKENNC